MKKTKAKKKGTCARQRKSAKEPKKAPVKIAHYFHFEEHHLLVLASAFMIYLFVIETINLMI